MLPRAHSWLDRHPAAGDTALAAVLLAFSLSTLFGEQFDADLASVAFTMALTVPLALRRRAPVAVFACVMLACGAELLVVDDLLAANTGALVALYTLIAYGPRRLAAIGFAVAVAGTVPFALHYDDRVDSGAAVTWLVVTIHILLAAALGDRMRARLREREGLREQTRLLAAERDQQATIAAAAERTRIARELHDVVAHSLSVVCLVVGGQRRRRQRIADFVEHVRRQPGSMRSGHPPRDLVLVYGLRFPTHSQTVFGAADVLRRRRSLVLTRSPGAFLSVRLFVPCRAAVSSVVSR